MFFLGWISSFWRKKISICLVLFALCGSVYAIRWPTKDRLSLSYAQGFHGRFIDGKTIYGMRGSFKYDRTMFFKESPVGFGYTFEIGGPFFFDVNDNLYSASLFDIGFNMYNALGVAIDIPLTKKFELYAIVDPCFDIYKSYKR